MFPSMKCPPGKHEQEEDPHLEVSLGIEQTQSIHIMPTKYQNHPGGSLLLLFSFLI